MVPSDTDYIETDGATKNAFLKSFPEETMLVMTFNAGKQLCKVTKRTVQSQNPNANGRGNNLFEASNEEVIFPPPTSGIYLDPEVRIYPKDAPETFASVNQ